MRRGKVLNINTNILNKFITIWVQIRGCYLFFFHHALIINAYVDDHTWKGIRHRNWGDDLNYYFIQKISNRPVLFYHNFKLAKLLHFKNYMCIGTILDAVKYANPQTIVLGSGVSGQDRSFTIPKNIISVRGKRTRDFLISHGIKCQEQYGDLALLLSKFYEPKKCFKKYRLGIIPHVIDLHYPIIDNIRTTMQDDILIIDLANYSKWTDVIDEICSCECIASSSLHGIIVSDSYGIPNTWIELSGNISGGYFKFFDYASSVDRALDKPFEFCSMNDIDRVISLTRSYERPNIQTENILKSISSLL